MMLDRQRLLARTQCFVAMQSRIPSHAQCLCNSFRRILPTEHGSLQLAGFARTAAYDGRRWNSNTSDVARQERTTYDTNLKLPGIWQTKKYLYNDRFPLKEHSKPAMSRHLGGTATRKLIRFRSSKHLNLYGRRTNKQGKSFREEFTKLDTKVMGKDAEVIILREDQRQSFKLSFANKKPQEEVPTRSLVSGVPEWSKSIAADAIHSLCPPNAEGQVYPVLNQREIDNLIHSLEKRFSLEQLKTYASQQTDQSEKPGMTASKIGIRAFSRFGIDKSKRTLSGLEQRWKWYPDDKIDSPKYQGKWASFIVNGIWRVYNTNQDFELGEAVWRSLRPSIFAILDLGSMFIRQCYVKDDQC
jgi:hypothetical protein